MRQTARAIVAVCSFLMLAACNTTDALVPRVDIGGNVADVRSSPVTQNDVEQMAGAPQQQAFPSPQPSDGYHPAYPQTAQAYQAGPGAPPTTLDAQASALDSDGFPPAPAASGLAATQQVDPSTTSDAPALAPPTKAASLAPEVSAGGTSIRFLPIIGAPVQAVTPLSRQLGTEARALGLSIKSSGDTSSAYILKGYLAAFTDNGSVTVTYVWDVLDNGGGRLHRIQGQESVPSAAQDPWAGVPASVMQQIASKTMADFSAWRQAQGG